MFNFKKDKAEILKTLYKLVRENLEFGDVNVDSESDMAEFVSDLRERKRIRKLRKLKLEVEKWMKEMAAEKHLKEELRKINEAKLQESNRVRAERAEMHQ